MSEKILELKGICKKYQSFELKDVSFDVERGDIVGFIGRNGAGKTTTLKAIMNLIALDRGEIFAFGKDMKDISLSAKQRIGFSLSEINYYPDNKIKSISSVIKRFYKSFDCNKYRDLLKKFSIDENKKIKELSSGMKVKYSLALALSHNAELLILDEPTSGLDPVSRDEIVEYFEEFVQDGQRSILFSTHITSDLEKCANKIVYIQNGVVDYSGNIKNLLLKYRLVSTKADCIQTQKRDLFVSYKVHSDQFTGLIESSRAHLLGIDTAEPSIEDIMVFLEKRDR